MAIWTPASDMGGVASAVDESSAMMGGATVARSLTTVRRRRLWGRIPLAPTLLLSAFVLMALFADLLAPASPYDTSLRLRFAPPFWMDGGTLSHPLGTDSLGRDTLSRLIFGARISLLVGLAAVGLGAVVGTVLGLIAGFYGGWLDAIIMRATDAMLSLPIILLAMLLAVTFGPGLDKLVIVLALVLWARFARLVRAETLTCKVRDYVALARVGGCSSSRLVLVHILPNVTNPLVVLATLQVGWVVVVEASLSFLGAGVPPPTPSWGTMIAEALEHVTTVWWLSVFPGVAVVLLVLSVNLLGDWLRDYLDPKRRRR